MKEKTNKVWSMDKTLVGTKESAGRVIWRCSLNKVFKKIVLNSQKIAVLEFLFNEVSVLETYNFVKTGL